MAEEIARKVQFVFEEEEGFRVRFANGVWGGPGAPGMVQANFFIDTMNTPKRVTVSLAETSHQVEQQEFDPAGEFPVVRRRMFSSVLLTAENAILIGQWFIEQGQQAQAAQAVPGVGGAGEEQNDDD